MLFEISVSFENGEEVRREARDGSTIRSILSQKQIEKATGAVIGGVLVDMDHEIREGDRVKVIGCEEEARNILRHSAAHVMAQAVKELYPDTRIAIGPSIEDGFYYDFDFSEPISVEDLKIIEKKMLEIKEKDFPFERHIMKKDEARAYFEGEGEIYKLEIIDEIEDDEVSVYKDGEFIDLCRGPHVSSTGKIGSVSVLSLAGAYWRGDEKRKMLTRIYGTAFQTEEQLNEYVSIREEAERRDHRKLGKELDLFSFHEDAGGGVVFYHPKGAAVINELMSFLRYEHDRRGYEPLLTPHLYKRDLWDKSGHTKNYMENMYMFEKEGSEYVVKPMNCPGHILIYKTRTRSYREMPIRFFETGTVYRFERSGVLHGLMRVRGFTQDDAHIFCTEEQLLDEICGVLDFALYSWRVFGFEDFEIRLSTMPEKHIGSDDMWDKATDALSSALEKSSLGYKVDPGEGAFYGPKIDIKLKDAIGRLWQGPTIQVDFNLPERFDLTYIDSNNSPKRPVMIHRVVLAGIERFFGIMIEHFAGAFPLWIAPVQVAMVAVADRHADRCREISSNLADEGFRVATMDERDTVPNKIRLCQVQKIPYTVVIGDRELEKGNLTVRKRSEKKTFEMSVDSFVELLREKVKSKALNL